MHNRNRSYFESTKLSYTFSALFLIVKYHYLTSLKKTVNLYDNRRYDGEIILKF